MATQKPPSKTAASPSGSNVHTLKPSPAPAQPLDGWALEGPFGHMSFEPGDGGRLVRLAELVKWLQSSRVVPRSEAVELLCEGMPGDVMSWLYWLAGENKGRATPVAMGHQFGYQTARQIEAGKLKDRQDALQAALMRERRDGRFDGGWHVQSGRITTHNPAPTEPGLPALLKYLRRFWNLPKLSRASTCDVLDDPRINHATHLAIPIDKAHELWGYGTCSKASPAAALPIASGVWTAERLRTQRAIFAADGGRAPMKRLAAMSGLTDRAIRRLIAGDEKPQATPTVASVWGPNSIKKTGKKS